MTNMTFAFKVTFTTDSDCEVLLHLYKEYGPHFLKKVLSSDFMLPT